MARIRRHVIGLTFHTILVLGALLFSFPFIWMILTSFKMDKEVFREGASLLTRMTPRIPDPRPHSPYIDPATFEPLTRPADREFPVELWTRDFQQRLSDRIARTIAALPSPTPASIAREDFEPEAWVLRRSMPWADDSLEGLVFVAFGKSPDAFEALLNRMVGRDDGITDALFRFTRPVSGSYYWCPPAGDGGLDLDALGAL